ncbi:DUF4190 domain-containing protein [Streptomyces sp. ALI-76-A]|jgi:hypothetical protein|uniref:DUF4190 domain-containing protein n=1 Tax=Streptomyces sp. ALI-76-A TaxID=3025736 RepID=UPI00256F5B43|nr:DUF4190 domain-containing protein [Streptomyces sp. ALI-76-A]MDL5204077.1 DUF4190 domain-containing protein [Streptomyces sp. ALI-76-A]
MSDANPGSGGFGPPPPPPSQPPQQPAGGYAYPQSAPGYGYPSPGPSYPGQAPSYPVAPAVGAYPQTPGYPGYAMAPQPSNGMGTTGLVLGIIGVVCSVTFFLWFFGVILGILGIIFGAIGRGKANRGEATNKGAATAGLVCGIVATVILPLLGVILFASVMGAFGAAS